MEETRETLGMMEVENSMEDQQQMTTGNGSDGREGKWEARRRAV